MKFGDDAEQTIDPTVTLHARVWIEIVGEVTYDSCAYGHPPREGVD